MKYRKKPVVIEAIQWKGNNKQEIIDFVKSDCAFSFSNELKINTLEGVMTALVNDYIICGVNGEFYPCKPDIFEQTYELVEE